jgi:hypothetical protein
MMKCKPPIDIFLRFVFGGCSLEAVHVAPCCPAFEWKRSRVVCDDGGQVDHAGSWWGVPMAWHASF